VWVQPGASEINCGGEVLQRLALAHVDRATSDEVGRRDEEAHGPSRGPFHTVNVRKVRQSSDSARYPDMDESPCKSG
jgi:hypothetical protein